MEKETKVLVYLIFSGLLFSILISTALESRRRSLKIREIEFHQNSKFPLQGNFLEFQQKALKVENGYQLNFKIKQNELNRKQEMDLDCAGFDDLNECIWDRYTNNFQKSLKNLKEANFDIHLVPHSHQDLGWEMTVKDYYEKCIFSL